MFRLYWLACGLLLAAGTALAIYAGEYYVSESGEMPPLFGAGANLIFLAIIGFIIGAMVKLAALIIRKSAR